jgi:hypothetical protein
MKNSIFVTAIALALIVPAMAWSQTAPAPSGNGGPPPQGMHGPNGGQGGDDRHEHFEERKAEVQKRMACVQAAHDHEALRVCLPERHEGGGER